MQIVKLNFFFMANLNLKLQTCILDLFLKFPTFL